MSPALSSAGSEVGHGAAPGPGAQERPARPAGHGPAGPESEPPRVATAGAAEGCLRGRSEEGGRALDELAGSGAHIFPAKRKK